MTRRRNVRPRIVLVAKILVVAAVTWLAFEWLGALVLRHQFQRTHRIDLDHRLKPASAPDINSDGIRSLREAREFAPSGFTIIFLGDSFTYGLRVPYRLTFPARVESALRARGREVQVANFGWPSASPLLSERLLRSLGPSYAPDLVILCVDLTDFHDDLKYAQPDAAPNFSPTRYLLRRFNLDWFLYLVGLAGDHSGPRLPPRFFVVNQPLEDSRPHLEAIEHNILAIRHLAEDELGVPFVLFLLPRAFQYSDRESPSNWEGGLYSPLGPWVLEPERWLEDFRRRADLDAFSLLPAFQATEVFPTCFEDDPHWNAAGHAVAAEAIVEVLLARGVADDRPAANDVEDG